MSQAWCQGSTVQDSQCKVTTVYVKYKNCDAPHVNISTFPEILFNTSGNCLYLPMGETHGVAVWSVTVPMSWNTVSSQDWCTVANHVKWMDLSSAHGTVHWYHTQTILCQPVRLLESKTSEKFHIKHVTKVSWLTVRLPAKKMGKVKRGRSDHNQRHLPQRICTMLQLEPW